MENLNILMTSQKFGLKGTLQVNGQRIQVRKQLISINMKLSQGRTRSVLEYVLQIPSIRQNQEIRDWLKLHLTANGLSSSKLITSKGIENKKESRRVEFRVRTNAEKRIVEIINRGKEE